MRVNRTVTTDRIALGVIVLILLASIAAGFFQAAMEAATYNRLTGSNVSAWDALFVELRVQDGVSEGGAK